MGKRKKILYGIVFASLASGVNAKSESELGSFKEIAKDISSSKYSNASKKAIERRDLELLKKREFEKKKENIRI